MIKLVNSIKLNTRVVQILSELSFPLEYIVTVLVSVLVL
jgi:hypothetical protein